MNINDRGNNIAWYTLGKSINKTLFFSDLSIKIGYNHFHGIIKVVIGSNIRVHVPRTGNGSLVCHFQFNTSQRQ
jgi:hypothetical protein